MYPEAVMSKIEIKESVSSSEFDDANGTKQNASNETFSTIVLNQVTPDRVVLGNNSLRPKPFDKIEDSSYFSQLDVEEPPTVLRRHPSILKRKKYQTGQPSEAPNLSKQPRMKEIVTLSKDDHEANEVKLESHESDIDQHESNIGITDISMQVSDTRRVGCNEVNDVADMTYKVAPMSGQTQLFRFGKTSLERVGKAQAMNFYKARSLPSDPNRTSFKFELCASSTKNKHLNLKNSDSIPSIEKQNITGSNAVCSSDKLNGIPQSGIDESKCISDGETRSDSFQNEEVDRHDAGRAILELSSSPSCKVSRNRTQLKKVRTMATADANLTFLAQALSTSYCVSKKYSRRTNAASPNMEANSLPRSLSPTFMDAKP